MTEQQPGIIITIPLNANPHVTRPQSPYQPPVFQMGSGESHCRQMGDATFRDNQFPPERFSDNGPRIMQMNG
jgi:hypothetical protein